MDHLVDLVHGWQASPAGRAAGHVTQLLNATSELRSMILKGEAAFVSAERPDIELAYSQLGRTIAAIRQRQEAAE